MKKVVKKSTFFSYSGRSSIILYMKGKANSLSNLFFINIVRGRTCPQKIERGILIMKIVNKSLESFKITDVKNGIDKNNRNWYMVKLENADGRINFFCNEFNFEKIANNVGKSCYLILEYTDSYNSRTKTSYTSMTVKDVEFVD